MKTREEITKQLFSVYEELHRIEREVPPGTGAWRETKRYIDALEWVLEHE